MTKRHFGRRQFTQLLSAGALSAFTTATWAQTNAGTLDADFRHLEQKYQGRLGLAALYSSTGVALASARTMDYRGQERFPFCSTFKVLVASAILKHSETHPKLLKERIRIREKDIVSWAPICEEFVGKSLDIASLCQAAMQHSDNTAANLLIRRLGGLEAINQWARSLGDDHFRLDRWETELNSALPDDERDTTTPLAMAKDLQQLCLGNALNHASRLRLNDWMIHNKTGDQRIRAALPPSWKAGDKTGTGAYGTTNDIAVILTTSGEAIILVIYFTQFDAKSKAQNDIMVEASKLVLNHWKLIQN